MNTYLLFKSLHLIAVISWMAGLLYLPRIFVYHSENDSEVKKSEGTEVGVDSKAHEKPAKRGWWQRILD